MVHGDVVPVTRNYVELGQAPTNGDIVPLLDQIGKCPACHQMVDKATHRHFGRKVIWNS